MGRFDRSRSGSRRTFTVFRRGRRTDPERTLDTSRPTRHAVRSLRRAVHSHERCLRGCYRPRRDSRDIALRIGDIDPEVEFTIGILRGGIRRRVTLVEEIH